MTILLFSFAWLSCKKKFEFCALNFWDSLVTMFLLWSSIICLTSSTELNWTAELMDWLSINSSAVSSFDWLFLDYDLVIYCYCSSLASKTAQFFYQWSISQNSLVWFGCILNYSHRVFMRINHHQNGSFFGFSWLTDWEKTTMVVLKLALALYCKNLFCNLVDKQTLLKIKHTITMQLFLKY